MKGFISKLEVMFEVLVEHNYQRWIVFRFNFESKRRTSTSVQQPSYMVQSIQ